MLTSKTTIVDDPSIDPTAIEPARVKVVLAGGEVIEVGSDTIKGSPQEPMTRDEQRAKLRGCLRFGLDAGDAAADRLADAVDRLEAAPDAARALIDAFPR